MPVPSSITDLSTTAGSNSPSGSESPITADDYLRTISAFVATLRDGKGQSAEATVASAATADIGAASSPFVQITGTTGITSFGTTYSGARYVRFAGSLTLTHNATTLILPAATNITTAAGDTLVAVPTGNPGAGWRVVVYQRADGTALVSNYPISVANGGTGATTAANARANLGLVIGTDVLAPNGSGAALTDVVPAGAVSFFAMSTAPAGWLKANGALVSRTTYAALFAAIGTTYGAGDGATTFALPDARGEFLRAWTDGSSVDSGRAFGSKQAATGFGSYVGPSATLYYTEADSTDGVGLSYFSIGGAGISGVYARVKPRNIAFLACIKY